VRGRDASPPPAAEVEEVEDGLTEVEFLSGEESAEREGPRREIERDLGEAGGERVL